MTRTLNAHNARTLRWDDDALRALLREQRDGNTLERMAERHGVSPGRIGALLKKARRLEFEDMLERTR